MFLTFSLDETSDTWLVQSHIPVESKVHDGISWQGSHGPLCLRNQEVGGRPLGDSPPMSHRTPKHGSYVIVRLGKQSSSTLWVCGPCFPWPMVGWHSERGDLHCHKTAPRINHFGTMKSIIPQVGVYPVSQTAHWWSWLSLCIRHCWTVCWSTLGSEGRIWEMRCFQTCSLQWFDCRVFLLRFCSCCRNHEVTLRCTDYKQFWKDVAWLAPQPEV